MIKKLLWYAFFILLAIAAWYISRYAAWFYEPRLGIFWANVNAWIAFIANMALCVQGILCVLREGK